MQFRSFYITFTSAAVILALHGCTSNSDTLLGEEVNKPKRLVKMQTPDAVKRDEILGATVRLEPTGNTPTQQIQHSHTAEESESALLSERITADLKSRPAESEFSSLTPIASVEQNVQLPQENRENYQTIATNPIILAANEPTSTFSIDVDSGSYANMRRFINSGTLPPADAIRVEELINYFSYQYERPTSNDIPFSINTEISPTPWNDNTHLVHIGLKGYEVDPKDRPAANLVFLIDVSGSMGDDNKLGLLKPAMGMLTNQLNENDSVSIVVYAGASGVVLEPTAGNDHMAINRAIEQLSAGGSTNGRAGIELAYDMAAKNFNEGSVNRVILATDGDFNVGISDVDKLKKLIEKKRDSGIALTTLGFGAGNYNDHLMEQLADVGNGAYAYIDNLNEARKVLADEVTSTLLTIAKDVKIQVEFNPAVVSEYRLIGYENRHLANEDFANDKIDAGDIGAGHTVTALYEVAFVGSGGERNTKTRYSKEVKNDKFANEIAELRLRYKAPQGSTSKLISQQLLVDDVRNDVAETSANFRFSAAVAALGQHLRDGKYLNDFNIKEVYELGLGARGEDQFGYRQEFVNLVRLVEQLDASQRAELSTQQGEPRG